MNQEELDFIYFKENQLYFVDFNLGIIDTKSINNSRIFKNVGSLNSDGYQRIWCNSKLRMKHRLIYWLYHNKLPKEIDHIDGNRNNNSIYNLKEVDRKENTTNKKQKRTFKQLTDKQVHEICKMLINNCSITEIANKFGRSRCQIKAIKLKKYWSKISDLYF